MSHLRQLFDTTIQFNLIYSVQICIVYIIKYSWSVESGHTGPIIPIRFDVNFNLFPAWLCLVPQSICPGQRWAHDDDIGRVECEWTIEQCMCAKPPSTTANIYVIHCIAYARCMSFVASAHEQRRHTQTYILVMDLFVANRLPRYRHLCMCV